MLKALSKKVKRNEGFTLIELVIVVAIIGILVAIAMPRMVQARKNAAVGAHNANVRTLEGAGLMYMAEKGDSAAGDTTDFSFFILSTSFSLGKAAADDDDKDDKTVDITDKVKPYIQDWPKVPALVKDGGKYTVKIAEDGSGVEVDPWYAELDSAGKVDFYTYPNRPGGEGAPPVTPP